MSQLARVELEQRGQLSLLRIEGEVDMTNADALGESIESLIPNGIPTVAIDLTATTYLDSAGIQLLYRLAERLRVRRRHLRVIVPEDSPIRAVLEVSGFSSLIPLEAGMTD